jgi:peptide/nickel transport system substrate-binding protein
MVEKLKGVMDPEQRVELIKQIAQYAHDNLLGGVTTYRPVITFAWRDKVDFKPWPSANWRNFQEVGLKQ